MVKILLVGKTARTDAIAEAFLKSKHNVEIYSFMDINNPGVIAKSKEFKCGSLKDFAELLEFAKKAKPDFAFIDCDDPIADGLADEFEGIGISSVAPKKNLAKLESSKSFTRNLMQKYKIKGNPKFKVFNSINGIKEFVDNIGEFVVKPDGLTGGKGVKVYGDHFQTAEEGIDYCKEVLETHSSVIVEERLEGEEFSLQCLSDGKHLAITPPAQDHKRAFEDDKGPNTGGMGSYSCENHLLPFLTKEDIDEATAITKKVQMALYKETNEYYKGVMYGGFIKTKKGIKLIEYNARFGDPEVMNILPILKTDFVDICNAILNQTLNKIKVEFENKATVLKYVCPEGYPTSPLKNAKVDISKIDFNDQIYFGSIEKKNNEYYMMGSRAIACLGIGNDLEDAEKKSQKTIEKIKGPVFYRKDIGTKELIRKRVEHIRKLFL